MKLMISTERPGSINHLEFRVASDDFRFDKFVAIKDSEDPDQLIPLLKNLLNVVERIKEHEANSNK